MIHHDFFEHGTQGTGAGCAFGGSLGEEFEGVGGESQGGAFEAKEVLVLADQGVFGLGEDLDQGIVGQGHQWGDDGQTPDEFGDEAVLDDIFVGDLGLEPFALGVVVDEVFALIVCA